MGALRCIRTRPSPPCSSAGLLVPARLPCSTRSPTSCKRSTLAPSPPSTWTPSRRCTQARLTIHSTSVSPWPTSPASRTEALAPEGRVRSGRRVGAAHEVDDVLRRRLPVGRATSTLPERVTCCLPCLGVARRAERLPQGHPRRATLRRPTRRLGIRLRRPGRSQRTSVLRVPSRPRCHALRVDGIRRSRPVMEPVSRRDIGRLSHPVVGSGIVGQPRRDDRSHRRKAHLFDRMAGSASGRLGRHSCRGLLLGYAGCDGSDVTDDDPPDCGVAVSRASEFSPRAAMRSPRVRPRGRQSG